MRTVDEVAQWFLTKQSMSPKKLQKILYYAYAWYLTFLNENEDNLENQLFDAEFQAWVHGPVIEKIYHDYKDYGFSDIPKSSEKLPVFDEDTLDILEQVWEVYGKYNGNQLESITHQEDPWINARGDLGPLDRCNTVISRKDMFNCYIKRIVQSENEE